jgi:uncharacterized protein (DUF2235 family)
MADHFKRTFSNENVKVHFVGAWCVIQIVTTEQQNERWCIRDTVPSIGILRGKSMLPGTADGMTHICYFRHALALDEWRVKFLPEYAYGGSAKPVKETDQSRGTWAVIQLAICADPKYFGTESKGALPQTEEVWFSGTHSDM